MQDKVPSQRTTPFTIHAPEMMHLFLDLGAGIWSFLRFILQRQFFKADLRSHRVHVITVPYLSIDYNNTELHQRRYCLYYFYYHER